ncbi:hypothetical protein OAD67_01225 [bacterium]|nr:hypothetical protein [bacterium]MDC1215218.1 hypothetical protein [bacterium]
MVCSKCEKKLSRGSHQEMWKEGSRNTLEGGRKINENKALTAKGKTGKWTPYGAGGAGGKCRICKLSLHQEGIFCQKCAYAQGQCSMCGVKVWDTTYHNVGGISEEKKDEEDESNAAGKDDEDGPPKERTVAEIEANEAQEKEKEKEDGAARKEKAEKVKATADAVVKNRLTGVTTIACAAREMATAVSGNSVTSWQFDSTSGLYFDVTSQQYYDPNSKKYFDCKSNKWLEPEKVSNAEMATGEKSGTFSKGTRKPDRFGL